METRKETREETSDGDKKGDKGGDKRGDKRWNRLERGREGETDVKEPKCYFTFSL